MTPTGKIALDGGSESPAFHGAFLNRVSSEDTKSHGLTVALCASDPAFGEQVAALLETAGHAVLARSASGDGLLASCIGNVPACVVIAADRPDRATVDIVHLVRSRLEGLPAVLVCRRAVQVSAPSEQRRALRARALTTREKQVLMLVAAGRTNFQIAAELFLAESTVKSHLSSAFGKLGVSSRSEAAALILDPERGSRLGIGRVAPAFAASR
jgi:DNA-binding CsgD family transcriptional regulator